VLQDDSSSMYLSNIHGPTFGTANVVRMWKMMMLVVAAAVPWIPAAVEACCFCEWPLLLLLVKTCDLWKQLRVLHCNWENFDFANHIEGNMGLVGAPLVWPCHRIRNPRGFLERFLDHSWAPQISWDDDDDASVVVVVATWPCRLRDW